MKSLCFVLHTLITEMVPKRATRSQPGMNTAPLRAGVCMKSVPEGRARVWRCWWTGSEPRLAADRCGEASGAAAPSRVCRKDQAENSSKTGNNLQRMTGRKTKGPAKDEPPKSYWTERKTHRCEGVHPQARWQSSATATLKRPLGTPGRARVFRLKTRSPPD